MLRAIILWGCLAAILALVDALGWVALAVLLPKPSSRGRKVAAIAWIALWVVAAGLLAAGMMLAPEQGELVGTGFPSFVLGFLALLYLPKLLLATAGALMLLLRGLSAAAGWTFRRLLDRPRLGPAPSRGREWVILGVAGVLLATGLFGLGLHGWTMGRHRVGVERLDVVLPGLPMAFDGLVVAHLADLHLGTLGGDSRVVDRAIAAVHAAAPALLVYTGDLGTPAEIAPWESRLAAIRAPLGKFAVLGNHDYGGRGAPPTIGATPATSNAWRRSWPPRTGGWASGCS
jgi:hypothetical protein